MCTCMFATMRCGWHVFLSAKMLRWPCCSRHWRQWQGCEDVLFSCCFVVLQAFMTLHGVCVCVLCHYMAISVHHIVFFTSYHFLISYRFIQHGSSCRQDVSFVTSTSVFLVHCVGITFHHMPLPWPEKVRTVGLRCFYTGCWWVSSQLFWSPGGCHQVPHPSICLTC